MAAVYGFCLALMLVMRLAPDSPFGKALNRQLVEVPLRLLGRMQRHHLIFLIIIVGLTMVGSEVIFALGTVDFAVIYALDLSLYVDGLLMTLALASLARTRSAIGVLRVGGTALAARLRRRLGRRRTRAGVRKPPAKSANDDDPAPAFASFGFHLAAA
jgi:hypothetical protein